jgi:soluble lytic murein transglycosylase
MRWFGMILTALAAHAQASSVPMTDDQLFLQAMQRAQAGVAIDAEEAQLRTHILAPYLRFYRLQKTYPTLPASELSAWLAKYQDELPLVPMLRTSLQTHYAAQKNWRDLVATYREAEANAKQKCLVWQARMALAPNAEKARAHALKLYQDTASVDPACEPAFAHLRAGGVSVDDAQKRFSALLSERKVSAARAMIGDLPEADRALANAQWLAQADAYSSLKMIGKYPNDVKYRAVQARALQRIASVSPNNALRLLQLHQGKLELDADQVNSVKAEAARVAIIANSPGSEDLLDSVPYDRLDAQALEWGVRRALKAQNFAAALKRLQGMTADQQKQARWAYHIARILELQGNSEQAKTHYQQAALESSFYGFLAADHLQQSYNVCPDESRFQPKLSSALLDSAALKRIDKLRALDLPVHAKREWMFLLNRLQPAERRQAGLLAAQLGWGEYAILALNQEPNRKLYHARFPILEQALLEQNAARNGLDAPFVAALIRQESAWNPRAQSHARALGLMQMLAGTAAITAKQIGFQNKIDLFEPKTNILLGTAHLSHLARKYDNSPVLMTAAYNAGASRVALWKDTLYQTHPDLWIETIPFKETRDYVTAVLAFSVIYDHRFDGKLVRLSSRVPEFIGRFQPDKAPAPSICATPSVTSAN